MNTSSPLVSVVIPCYNHAKYLPAAIESALGQTYPQVEVVVINDGSPDATDAVCRGYGNRVVYVNQANRGLAAARNAGISRARGDYILPLDADDKLTLDSVAQLVPVLQSAERVGFVYGHKFYFSENERGQLIDPGHWQTPDWKPDFMKSNACICHPGGFLEVTAPDWNEEWMLWRNEVSCTTLYRRADWERVGGYSEQFAHGLEDWDLFLSLIDLGREGACVHAPVFYYRMHQGMSMRSQNGLFFLESYRRLMRRHPQLFQRQAIPTLEFWLRQFEHQIAAGSTWEQLYWEARPGRLERYGIPVPVARLLRRGIRALRGARPKTEIATRP